MAGDSGKIDIGGSFDIPKSTGPLKKEGDARPSSSGGGGLANHAKQSRAQNKSVYKNASISQQELGFDASEKKSQENVKGDKFANSQSTELTTESGLKKDYEIRHKNPVLSAKLENPKPHISRKRKDKKQPPKPSLKVKLAPKGYPINPRKVKPHIPGRLQSFFDDNMSQLEKLNKALQDFDMEAELGNQYANKMINSVGFKISSSHSIIDLLGLDESIFEKGLEPAIVALINKAEVLKPEKELFQFLVNVLNLIATNPDQNPINHLVQLFLPLPLPFMFEEEDEEFEEDDEELYKDDDESFFADEDDPENEEEDPEYEYDSSVSMSIKTLNFNKLHFIIKFNHEHKKVKLGIKADPMATELAIPIESNLEDSLMDSDSDLDYMLRLWQDNVLRVTEQRVLKIKSEGRLSPMVLKSCNSILETIYNNDIDYSEDTMNGKFNLI